DAFAAQVIPSYTDLGVDLVKLNVNGGAIAVGHPFGMTGARITTTLLNSLQFHDATPGLETMCVGGGTGMAKVFPRASSPLGPLPDRPPGGCQAACDKALSAEEELPWRCQLSLTHSPNLHNSLIARIPVTTGRTLAEWFHRIETGPAFLRREEQAHWLADDAG